MKRIFHFCLICVIFFEIIIPSKGIINLPGPFSLAKWLFVFYGFMNIRRLDFVNYILLIPLGCVLSSLTSNNVLDNMSNSLGTALLYLAGLGFMNFIFSHRLWSKVIFYMLNFGFVYWIVYVLNLYVSGEVSTYYDFNSPRQSIRTINHHVFGWVIGFGTVMYFIRSLMAKGIRKILFACAVMTGCFVLFFISSRANLLSVIIISTGFYLQKKGQKVRNSFVVLILIFFGFTNTFDLNIDLIDERVKQRNSVSQESVIKSNESRLLLYKQFINVIPSYLILGRGPLENHLIIPGIERKYLAHNTYISLILAGGFLAFVSIILFLRRSWILREKLEFMWSSDLRPNYSVLMLGGLYTILGSIFFYDLGGLAWIFLVTYFVKIREILSE